MSHDADPPPSSSPPPSQSAPTPSATPPQRPPRLALLIATGFGLGYLPKAPGTWGSLGAGGIVWGLWMLAQRSSPEPPMWALATMLFWIVPLLAVLGVAVSDSSSRFVGQRDPQVVIIDEISGQLITYFGLSVADSFAGRSFGWQYLLAGLILFRVFDIWKPWPVREAEKLPGGWGIMADDWVAGIYAGLCLWVLRAAGM